MQYAASQPGSGPRCGSRSAGAGASQVPDSSRGIGDPPGDDHDHLFRGNLGAQSTAEHFARPLETTLTMRAAGSGSTILCSFS